MTVVARFSGDAGRIAEAFRREVLAVDPAMPTLGLVTLDEHLRLALVVERVTALLVGLLGGLGLILSVIGLYGVVAFLVSRRTREIGIRMALGARPGQLVAEVVGQGGRPAMAGVVIGLVMAAGVARFVSSVLYGVSPADPLVFGAATLLVVLVASGAAWLPARRAARVNPVEALRADG
jgi:ABC-type antimicrobial peptide transport system permease subunit